MGTFQRMSSLFGPAGGARALVALALALSTAAAGCLPGDTRPPPESVYVTAEPSAAVQGGFDTADGFRVTFDRLLLGVGNIGFEDDDAACNVYAEAWYDRLFDFTVTGREKVGTVYGLGACRLQFRVREPSSEALLGAGVTAADLALMRVRLPDHYTKERQASVVVTGSAARGGEAKRFAWAFRRSYGYTDCETSAGGFSTTLALAEGGASALRLEVRGEELFRAFAKDRADLLFQPMADADADADGEITLDELAKAPRPAVDPGEMEPGDAPASAGEALPPDVDPDVDPGSMEYLVYEELLPRLLRALGGGPCKAELRGRRRF
jgi:hypothetical protein